MVLVQNAADRFRPGLPVHQGRSLPWDAGLGAAHGRGPLEQGLQLLAVRLYRVFQDVLHALTVAGIDGGASVPVQSVVPAPDWLPGGAAGRPIGRELDRVVPGYVAVRVAFLPIVVLFLNMCLSLRGFMSFQV